MSLRILLLGSGGREHALAWKLSKSDLVDKIFLCPGNGGTAFGKCSNTPPKSFNDLVEFATENEINLLVPGPEQPLVDGIETVFRKVGIPVFGPSRLAARMEGSKAFSKAFMTRHNIPTSRFQTFSSAQIVEAIDYVKSCGYRVVLKADGLAAGKGVLIPESVEEAIAGLNEILVAQVFGLAGSEVVVEEYLEGPEISVLAFSDGYTIVPLPAAQDHKRIGDGDTGPNTGGMGAYAPAPVATPTVMSQIMRETLRPTIDGMRKEGFPFVGMLFTGFILTSSGPKVLEYNVRFGDPETEALMLLLDDTTDLAAILLACVEHRLDFVPISTRPGVVVSVVVASQGYPGSYTKGQHIKIGDKLPDDTIIFHAGTTRTGAEIMTAGGRVLVVSAYASSIETAIQKAYEGVDLVSFEGMTYRRDIAYKALQRHPGVSNPLTYAAAGVSIDAGAALVEAIKPYVRSTRRPGANPELGGFGGLFDLKATGYNDPVLVSGTDGVGTKLRIALEMRIHDYVGIDLVAMSVNDLLVQGAEPLFFLDYYGCGKLDVSTAAQVIKGIAEGCLQSNCSLIGGETAEMPDMYPDGDYDLAGFAVGVVERSLVLPRPDIEIGDILLGLTSSGLHSNGFSLLRKIISLKGLNYQSICPWDASRTLGAALLEPTRIYVRQVLPAAKSGLLKAMSHITGGGFVENLPRMLPADRGCRIDVSSWQLPPAFRFILQSGVEPLEMARTFNNGIGLVVVVGKDNLDQALATLEGNADVVRIGEVTATPGVDLVNLESWLHP